MTTDIIMEDHVSLFPIIFIDKKPFFVLIFHMNLLIHDDFKHADIFTYFKNIPNLNGKEGLFPIRCLHPAFPRRKYTGWVLGLDVPVMDGDMTYNAGFSRVAK